MKIPAEAYRDPDPLRQARFFLGKTLRVRTAQGICGGLICETEAYGGAEDKACHGYGNRRTARTETMFAAGGVAYVYLCYGLHYLLNFVTGPQDVPQAVLIRAVQITEGEEWVAQRRPGVSRPQWANGPGKVTVALGLGKKHQGCDLTGSDLWVEDRGIVVPEREIQRTSRIGVDYAGLWAKKPWRLVWSKPLLP